MRACVPRFRIEVHGEYGGGFARRLILFGDYGFLNETVGESRASHTKRMPVTNASLSTSDAAAAAARACLTEMGASTK